MRAAFSIRIGIRRALVVSSWQVAVECFNTNDKVFLTGPKSLAVELVGYDHAMLGTLPYGPYWCDMTKLATVQLLLNHQIELLQQIRD